MANTKGSSMPDMVNAMREASPKLAATIPMATAANIADVGNPIISYAETMNQFLTMLIDRIGMTKVRNKTYNNPLRILKQGTTPLGIDVQEIYTNPATATQFDPSATTPWALQKPDTKVAYHRRNRQDKYKVSVSNQQIRAAFTSWSNLEDFLSSIVNTLYSGDNIDEFQLCKEVFASGVADSKIKTQTVTAVTDETSGKAFVKAARTASGLFRFPGSNYNMYSTLSGAVGEPVVTWTPIEDQILLIKSEILSAIDVDVLAAAFNMGKSDFLGRVVEVDDFGTGGSNIQAILMDKSAPQIYDNLEQFDSLYNPENLTWNYYWHHWQTYSFSLFANMLAFVTAGD